MYDLKYLAATVDGLKLGKEILVEPISFRTIYRVSTFYSKDGEATRKQALALHQSKEYTVARPNVKAFWLWLIYLKESDRFAMTLESPTAFKPNLTHLELGFWYKATTHILDAGGYQIISLVPEKIDLDTGITIPEEVQSTWDAKLLILNDS